MYSEKIDTILEALNAYNEDMRSMIKSIIEDIMKYAKTEGAHTINVAYYTESEITGYNFNNTCIEAKEHDVKRLPYLYAIGI